MLQWFKNFNLIKFSRIKYIVFLSVKPGSHGALPGPWLMARVGLVAQTRRGNSGACLGSVSVLLVDCRHLGHKSKEARYTVPMRSHMLVELNHIRRGRCSNKSFNYFTQYLLR